MATTAHHIVSHYTTPAQEGDDIREDEIDIDALWHAESSKINSVSAARRPYRIPTFVRATAAADVDVSGDAFQDLKGKGKARDIAGWYQQLHSSSGASTPGTRQAPRAAKAEPSTLAALRPTSEPLPRKKPRRAEQDWFIHRAILSQTHSSVPTLPPPTTLADLLAHEPPPLPHEVPFKPPIWYAIDPSNKGFEMLRRKGWEEGRGLGAAHPSGEAERNNKRKREDEEDDDTELSEDENEEEDLAGVIDLTHSSPEPEETIFQPPALPPPQAPTLSSTTTGTALLTPLRPVLKNDRLGLGLKAKKKSSLSAAAIAAHIRAGEETKRKAEREKWGRGGRAFARQMKREEDRRREMLSYMNS